MKLILFGNSELAKVLSIYFEESGKTVDSYIVDESFKKKDVFNGKPLYTTDYFLENFSNENFELFICIGDLKINKVREKKYNFFKSKGFKFASLIHKNVTIGDNVKLGEHLLILEGNNIQHNAQIGDNSFLWSSNHIGHSSIIGKNVFISSNVTISGCTSIGDNSFVGVGSTFANDIEIGKFNYFGNGCNITTNTKDYQIYKSSKPILSKVKSDEFFK